MPTSVMARSGAPSLLVFLILAACAASFGALFQPGAWYEHLTKPSWNPPNTVFAPVWTVLYIMMGIAGWRVWRSAGRFVAPLQLWMAQLLLNAVWSFLFFGIHRMDIALVDIGLLLVAIVTFIATARGYSKLASWLFVPYALWVSFATALNFTLWRLNDPTLSFGG